MSSRCGCGNQDKLTACHVIPINASAIKESGHPIIWMFGGPGSGKTTQSQKMVTVYQFVHVSLSEQLKNPDPFSDPRRSKQLTEIMASDHLELIKESLLKGLQHSKTCNGFVVDGYPKDKNQAINFERHIGTADLIMYLKCDDLTMKNRVGFRAKAADEYEDEGLTNEQICDFKKNRDEVLKLYEHKVITFNAEKTEEDVFEEIGQILKVKFNISYKLVIPSPVQKTSF